MIKILTAGMILALLFCGCSAPAPTAAPAIESPAESAVTPAPLQTAEAQTDGYMVPGNLDQLMAEVENLLSERDAMEQILQDEVLRTGSAHRLSLVSDAYLEGETLRVELATVLWLTGEAAVSAVIEDEGLPREEALMETEGGYYLKETGEKEVFGVREGAVFYMEEPFSRLPMANAEFLLYWGDEDEPWQKRLPYDALIYQGEVVLLQSRYIP